MDNNLDDDFNKFTGQILRNFRCKKGYSLEDVVKKMKHPISRQALFKYESNMARIKLKTFEDICDVLELNPLDVYNDITQKLVEQIQSDKMIEQSFKTKTREEIINEVNESYQKLLNLQIEEQNKKQDVEELINEYDKIINDYNAGNLIFKTTQEEQKFKNTIKDFKQFKRDYIDFYKYEE